MKTSRKTLISRKTVATFEVNKNGMKTDTIVDTGSGKVTCRIITTWTYNQTIG